MTCIFCAEYPLCVRKTCKKNPDLSAFQFGAIYFEKRKKKSSLLLFQFIDSAVDQLI